MSELRYALRALRRNPGFTAVAVFTLALGIGANVALFAVARGVLVRPLDFPDPDRLVRVLDVRTSDDLGTGNASYPNIHDWDRFTSSFDGIAGMQWWTPALTHDGETEVVHGATVSWNWFQVFGVRPAAGRFFTPDDEGAGREPVMVLSHELWQRVFGGEPEVVGGVVRLGATPYTVIGVAEPLLDDPSWRGPGFERPEFWHTPWFDAPAWYRSGRSWRAFGRLGPDVSLAAAQAELSGIMARLGEAYPEENAGREVRLVRLRDHMVADARPALELLLASVGFVLLIACVNVAGLALGRVSERAGELAIRRALGASGRRLARQLLTESLALSLIAGAVGLALAAMSLGALVALAGPALARPDAIRPDAAVLAFSAVLTVAAGLMVSIIPALRASRPGPGGVLAPGRSSAGRERVRFRRALVAVEVALTVTLLAGAGHLLRTFHQLMQEDLGIVRQGVLTFDVHGEAFRGLSPLEAAERYREIFASLLALPGVAAVGAIDVLPLSGGYSCDAVRRDDRPPPAPGAGRCAEVRSVTPGIFEALGVTVLRGRGLDWLDDHEAVRVVLVSEAMADAFWPGEDALGKSVTIHDASFEVVGIASDVHHFGPGGERRPQVYLPAAQEPWNGIARGLSLVLRGAGPRAPAELDARRAIRSVDPGIPVRSFRTMDALLDDVMAPPRFRTILMGAFGALALLLSVVGLAGVMAYSVSRRTREIGLRLAVGAAPGAVRAMVVREGISLVAIGLALGLPGAVVAGGLLERFLFGAPPTDPMVLTGAAALLVAAALLSSWLPARRAARIDPMEALRHE